MGSVRVGLAASDPGGVLATPVETIERDLLFGADLGVIAAAVLERHVLEDVVGLPRALSGDEGPEGLGACAYARALAPQTPPAPQSVVP